MDRTPDVLVEADIPRIDEFRVPGKRHYFLSSPMFAKLTRRFASKVVPSNIPSRRDGDFVLKLQPLEEINPTVGAESRRWLGGFWEPAPVFTYSDTRDDFAMDQIPLDDTGTTEATSMRSALLEGTMDARTMDKIMDRFQDSWEALVIKYSEPPEPDATLQLATVPGSGLTPAHWGIRGRWVSPPGPGPVATDVAMARSVRAEGQADAGLFTDRRTHESISRTRAVNAINRGDDADLESRAHALTRATDHARATRPSGPFSSSVPQSERRRYRVRARSAAARADSLAARAAAAGEQARAAARSAPQYDDVKFQRFMGRAPQLIPGAP
jgi:hypothetical protein